MGDETVNYCVRHYEEPTADACRTCRHGFCSRCLVYAFGPKKPPYCVGCALSASGVRSNRPPVVVEASPGQQRRSRAERKAEKAARKLAAKQAKAPTPAPAFVPPHPQPLGDGVVPPPPPAYTPQVSDHDVYEQSA